MVNKFNYLRKFSAVLMCALLALSTPAIGKSTGKTIQSLLQNSSALEKGKSQFLLHCAGCHKKDLSGAVGFNLKDGEWVHGGQPEQILQSLQQGFDKAGMPGFGPILPLAAQHAIVAYILSKREGFENLQYKIYQLESADDGDFSDEDLVASGRLKKNLADFELPEIPHYAIVFSGTFYGPKNQKSYLYAERIKNLNIKVGIDGKSITPVTYGGVQKWLLNKGKQQLNFTFYSGNASAYLRNIELYVVNQDASIKLFPVSSQAHKQSKNSRYEIKAAGEYLVQQKKIVKLPAYSMAIGSPQKANYAFNSRSCAINGLWKGDLLNVGPNIGGRGKDGSIPLGDWVFHHPQQIKPVAESDNNQPSCQLIKYRINGAAPEFYFTVNGLTLMVTSDFTRSNQGSFVYRIIDNPSKLKKLTFTIPSAEGLQVSSEQGQVIGETLSVDIQAYSNFSIQLTWAGDK
jgi:mono/diheme cytochrome c family protein